MKQFYLIGQNIQGSLSPQIHKIIFNELGVKADYSLYSSDKLCLPQSFDGLNVTFPYKESVVSMLDADFSQCGSINTVIKTDQNKLYGYSTDGEGFLLDAKRLGLDLSDALIIGSGGAAKSIALALKKSGGLVSVSSRTKAKEQSFCKQIGILPHKTGKQYTVAINCTPSFSVDNFSFQRYYDIKYGGAGDGLGMLIFQAVLAAQFFLGTKIDYDIFHTIHRSIK